LSRLLWPFWNRVEGRLRALVRLAIQLLLVLLVAILLQTSSSLLIGLLRQNALSMGNQLTAALGYSITLVSILISMFLAARFLDLRPFPDYGFHLSATWWLDLGFGLLLGAVLMMGIFLVELSAGWVIVMGTFQSVGRWPFVIAILVPLFVFICVGVYEETLSRGYQLHNLAEGLNLSAIGPKGGLVLAWLVSSSVFGLLHAFNPNATVLSTLFLMLAGLFLGLGYVLTGELGISIGVHISWNFFQGNVFGFPVSGSRMSPASFVAIQQAGPRLWTGGAFGPEAGLVGILALALGSLLILAWVRVAYGHVRLHTSLARYRTQN